MNHKIVSQSNEETNVESLIFSDLPKKLLKGCYGFVCYAASMFSLVYFILYINDVLITNTANSAVVTLPVHVATINNLGLLLLFGLQHSIMARPKFKQWLKKYLDPALERATFCLSTSIVLVAICLFWAPMNGEMWSIETNWIAYSLQGLAGFGWLMLVLSSFNIDHFELFGIRQVYCLLVNKPMPKMSFKVGGFYKWVRHPIQSGLLIGMWSVPHSSMTHFTLAVGFTIYVFVGLYFEEKDLIREFGQTYLAYKKRVGGVIPKVFKVGK